MIILDSQSTPTVFNYFIANSFFLNFGLIIYYVSFDDWSFSYGRMTNENHFEQFLT